MMRKLITLIVAAAMIFECNICVGAVSSDDEFYLYYEDFNSYATNEKPEGVLGSYETRVVENGTINKSLYLSGKETMASYTVTGEFNSQFVIDMNITRLAGKSEGDYISIGSNSAVAKLLSVTKFGSCLSDGRPILGIGINKSTRVIAKVNLLRQKYDLYIGNRCVATDYPIGINIDTVSMIKTQVSFTDGQEGGLIIDDVKVYKGVNISNRKVKTYYNEQVLPWPGDLEQEDIPFEKIYLEDFESYEVGNSVIKETTVSQKNENNSNFIKVEKEKENKFLHYYRHTTDPLLDFICTSKFSNLVAEAAFMPKSITGSARFLVSFIGKNSTGNFKVLDINSSGTVSLADGTNIGKVNMKEWNKIIFIFRQDSREYDIYINNKMIASGVKFATETFPYLEKIRFTSTESGVVDFCVDTVAVYKGNKPIENLGEKITEMYDSYRYPSVDEVLYTTDNMLIFSTNNTVCKAIAGKRLINITNKPILYNDDIYLTEELVLAAGFEKTGNAVTVNGKTIICTQINNSDYYQAKLIAGALNSKIFTDMSGFSVISADADTYYADWQKYWEIKLVIQYNSPSKAEIYSDFTKTLDLNQHPRLVISADDVGRLRGEIEFDPVKKELFKKLVVQADNDLNLELPKQVLHDGVRMAIHDYRHPVVRMAFVYLMTGDMKYAEKVKQIVLTEAQFTNWNPSIHYLDTGVAGTTVAIGYDWLYDLYTPAEREIIEKGITRNMLDAAYSGLFNGEYSNFPRKTEEDGPAGNWTAIATSGAVLSALAIMETNPEYCSKIIEGSLRNFQYMLPAYEPDGAWEEGVGYWGYTAEFYCYIIESLKNSLGTDYRLCDAPGLSSTAYFPYDMLGSVGSFNFGDADEDGANEADFGVSWFAYAQKNSELYSLRYKELISGARPWPIDLIYLDSESCNRTTELPLDKYYRGINSGSMRSEFFNTSATYVGYHCGKNTAGHNHYETGEFIFDSLGVRWALDLGKDDYNLKTYNAHQDTAVYRIRTEGHNCYVINPDEHAGQAEFNGNDGVIRRENNNNSSLAIMDLSETYGENALSAKRGIKLGDMRNTLLVRDEIDLKKDNSDFYWFMHTKADVTVDGNIAYLKQKGQTMKFEFTSNQPLELSVMDAKPLPTSPIQEGQNENIGIRKIAISGKASGQLVVNVKLSPVIEGVNFGTVSNIPLAEWVLDDAISDIIKPTANDLRVNGRQISGFNLERRNYSYLYPLAEGKLNVSAECDEKYNVNISLVNDEEGEQKYQILISDKANPMLFTLYSIVAKQITDSNMRNGETFNMPVRYWASAEPQSANNINNIIDGDLSTRWSANGENYVIYELEDIKAVSAVDIAMHNGDARSQFFTLQVSEDGENFTTVYDNIQSSGTTNLPERYELNGINAKYIKLICYKTTVGDWNSITEMYVYTN